MYGWSMTSRYNISHVRPPVAELQAAIPAFIPVDSSLCRPNFERHGLPIQSLTKIPVRPLLYRLPMNS